MYDFDPARLAKLAALRADGVPPYPHGLRVTHTLASVRDLIGARGHEALAEDRTEVLIAGRVMARNEMGKAGLVHSPSNLDPEARRQSI